MPATLSSVGRVPIARTADGLDIAWYDFGGDGDPLLLCHATGFHAHVWLPAVEHLRAAGFHCYGFDERGHGDSSRPADGDFAWDGFARDALAVLDAAGLERPLAAGHSCGGALLLLAEQQRPGTFRSRYLYEPIVRPDEPGAPDPSRPGDRDLAEGAARRRATFASFDAAYDNYASKPPFSALDRDALRAYVGHGFAIQDDGSVGLKCRPADEAAVYRMSTQHRAYRHLGEVRCPAVLACGARTDVLGAAVMQTLAAAMPDARTEVLPGLGHFGPLEDPAAVAARITAAFHPA
jgi:pimeloyl-ACP methyl ester carboxylesterase